MSRVCNLGAIVSLTVFGLSFHASVAMAQDTKKAKFDPVAANVSCVIAPAKLSDAEVNAFLAKPNKILTDNPGGGLTLSNTVRGLVVSSSKAYSSVVGLVKVANTPQKAAIGAALSRSVAACKDNQPDFAQAMMEDVVGLSDADLLAGYTGANTDTNVASVSGPGASSAQGGGAVDDTNSQNSAANSRNVSGQSSVQDPVSNSGGLFDFSSGGGPGLVNDVTNDVSPSSNG